MELKLAIISATILTGVLQYVFFRRALRESKKRYFTSFTYLNVWFQLDGLWEKSKVSSTSHLSKYLIMFEILFVAFIFSITMLFRI